MPLGNGSIDGSSGSINKLQHNAPLSPGEDEKEEERNNGAAMISDSAENATAPQQPPPASTNNVGELVTKAKKAAASLWMILHAQVRLCFDCVAEVQLNSSSLTSSHAPLPLHMVCT